MVLLWILIFLVFYFFLFFVLPLILLPGFIGKREIEKSPKLSLIAKKLRGRNKEETLKNVFNYVQKTYSSERPFLLILLHKHFYRRITRLIGKKQFLPCHIPSLVLITLLVNTGQFSKEDLKRKTQMSLFGFIHQYYLIKIGRIIFKADPFYNILRLAKPTEDFYIPKI
ncbi:MAG: hypothetical protein NUV97_04080 [archaeon]|nr:hypothetical protein [archaeon]